MHLFGPNTFLEDDLEAGLFETWKWLMGRFGDVRQRTRDPLVTPTPEFFPPTTLTGHALASEVLQRVMRLMMADMACELAPIDREDLEPDQDGPPLITYTDASQPWLLVSELAHEVAALMLSPGQHDLPEGRDSFWPATSLLVVHKGLGIFALNGAFQVSRGTASYSSGFLTQQSFAFALAAYLAMTNRIGAADGWIGTVSRDLLHKAQKYFARNPGLLPGAAITA